jgi:tetratricopeptide (TPR) repeat protein
VTQSTTSQSLLAAALQHFARQQPQRGLELAEQAAAAANGNDELIGVATLLLRFGRPAKAAEVFRAMLTANPRSITALANIAQLEREHDMEDVSAMLELAGTTDPDRDSGIQLNFALGKTFADLGQFDRSFEFYARARTAEAGEFSGPCLSDQAPAHPHGVPEAAVRAFSGRRGHELPADLHRRHAALGFDVDRADPCEPSPGARW